MIEGDRYRPLSRLSQRAGRQTLLAQDFATGQKVVVKILGFGEGFVWDDLKLFEREAELLRSLDHPGIPRYLDSSYCSTSKVTSDFMVDAFESWWLQNQHRFPEVVTLLFNQDNGPSEAKKWL